MSITVPWEAIHAIKNIGIGIVVGVILCLLVLTWLLRDWSPMGR